MKIGDQTWEFDVSTFCLSQFGAFGAAGKSADGRDVAVDLSLPPNDWETRTDFDDWNPPALRVGDNENDHDWVSGSDVVTSPQGVVPQMSQVTSFRIDGSTATGTASFVDANTLLQGDNPELVEGSFEFNCDDEPYS